MLHTYPFTTQQSDSFLVHNRGAEGTKIILKLMKWKGTRLRPYKSPVMRKEFGGRLLQTTLSSMQKQGHHHQYCPHCHSEHLYTCHFLPKYKAFHHVRVSAPSQAHSTIYHLPGRWHHYLFNILKLSSTHLIITYLSCLW